MAAKKKIVVEVPDPEADRIELNPEMTREGAYAYLGHEYDRAHGKYEAMDGDRRQAARRDACKELAQLVERGPKDATYTKESLAADLAVIQDHLNATVPKGASAFEIAMAAEFADEPAEEFSDEPAKE